jgi:hypothetical protein
MTKPLLIGLTGIAGAGKDTVRDFLQARHEFNGIAFADPIRDMLSALFASCGVSDEWMTERHLKEKDIPSIGASYRKMAQMLGTEWGREIDPNFWLKITEAKVRYINEIDSGGIVISDVRFPNEAEWVQSQGGLLWKVLRPGIESVRSHASEELINSLPYDYVIDNRGSIEELGHAVDMALDFSLVKVD